MISIAFTILATALSLLVIDIIFPGVTLSSFSAALTGALVLGGVNSIIRPILALFSLPLTILSLGGFTFVINGFCFWLSAYFVPGFRVSGLLEFIIAPLILSGVSAIFSHYFADKFLREPNNPQQG